MSNVERRIPLEGPEPEGLKELVEAGRDVTDMTPEQGEPHGSRARQRAYTRGMHVQTDVLLHR